MRFCILLTIMVAPQLAHAQFSEQYEAGSYVLSSDGAKRMLGQLRLKNHQKLLVITSAGRKLRLKPNQVSSFQLGVRSYVVARDFLIQQGPRSINVKAAFAERLDSGQVTLLQCTYLYNSGANWLFLYRYPISFYLVSNADEHLIGIHNYYKYQRFQQEAREPLKYRSDLLQMLDEGHITYENFPAAIQALNNNVPFRSPAVIE